MTDQADIIHDSFIPPTVELMFREIEGSVIAMNREAPRFIRISPLGREILSLADGISSIGEIAGKASQKGLMNEDEALFRVREFFSGAVKSGIFSSPSRWGLEDVPKGVYLEVTRRCNQQCVYCYAGGSPGGAVGLDTTELKGIISRMARAGAGFFIFSGGEPLTRRDIFELLEHASALTGQVSLVTNGTLIDSETAVKLRAVKGLSVRISLDGAESAFHDPLRGHGTFGRAFQGLQHLTGIGMNHRISICMTVSRINIHQGAPVARFALMHGIKSLVFTPLALSGRGAQSGGSLAPEGEDLFRFYLELMEIQDRYRDDLEISGSLGGNLLHFSSAHQPVVRCPVGRRVAVDYLGRIYPCSLMMEKPFITGSALSEDSDGDGSSHLMKSFGAVALGRRNRVKECARCFWNAYCGAGCMARSWQKDGSLLVKDPDCEIIIKLLDRLALRIPL